MATSGSTQVNACWTSSGNLADWIVFSWSRSGYSISGNYSDINWSLTLHSGGAGAIYSSASKSWSVNVNGSYYSGSNTVGIGNNTSKTLASGSTRIYHNNDGTKSFSYSFSQVFNITFNNWVGTISGSGGATLDTIPRYANINSHSLSNVTQTSVTYSWSASATCKTVEYWQDGQRLNSNSINASSGSYTFTGLSPGTNHGFGCHIQRSDSSLWTESSELRATTLPIASLTESSYSFNIGDNLPITFQNFDQNASVLSLSVEDDNGEWIEDVSVVNIPINTESYTWNLSEIADTLYGYCKTKNQMNIKISCGVTLNGTFYENIYNGVANVVNSDPVFQTCDMKNTDEDIVSLLGDTSYSIERAGNFQVSVSSANKAVPQNKAYIVRYISYMTPLNTAGTVIKSGEAAFSDTSVVTIDLGNYSAAGNYDIYTYAVDSRGNVSASVKHTCMILPYTIPVPSLTIYRQNNFEQEILINLQATYSRLVVGTTPKNSIVSVSYRYAEVGSSYPSAYTQITGYTAEQMTSTESRITYTKTSYTDPFLILNIEKSYNIEFRIEDKLNAITFETRIEQGVPIMGEFDDGHITIGKLPDMENSSLLQVNSDISAIDAEGIARNIFATMANLITISELEPDNQIINAVWLQDVTSGEI